MSVTQMQDNVDDSSTRDYSEFNEAPANETKQDRFKRMANLRVNNALQKIGLLGNLSNRQTYEYTEEHVEAIRTTLQRKLDDVISQFAGKKKDKDAFSI